MTLEANDTTRRRSPLKLAGTLVLGNIEELSDDPCALELTGAEVVIKACWAVLRSDCYNHVVDCKFSELDSERQLAPKDERLKKTRWTTSRHENTHFLEEYTLS